MKADTIDIEELKITLSKIYAHFVPGLSF